MKTSLWVVLCIILLVICAGCTENIAGSNPPQGNKGDKGDQGIPGSNNMTPNMTAGPTGATGSMNLTPNMTAGSTGATGAMNQTPNLTTTGYTLTVQGLALATVTNSSVYVFGGSPKIPATTTMGLSNITVPKTGTITAIIIDQYGTTAGSAETWEMDLSKNLDTSRSNLIKNVTVSATHRTWANYSMSIPVVAGDTLEIRSICPAWATKPVAVVFNGVIYIV